MRTGTLCFLIKDGKILLGKKKRGFGIDKWNGIGGKPKQDESIEQSLIREVQEEIGAVLSLESINKMGVIKFNSQFNPNLNWHVHVYTCFQWDGNIAESEEMLPKWFPHSEIPFEQMWADDKHWLPLVLQNQAFEAEFHFDETEKDFVDFKIKKL